MSRVVDVMSSYAVSVLRPLAGMYVAALGPRPQKTLELYEFEGCPFCRKVREALSVLDLEAMIHPCPKNGTRWRPKVAELGGKAQFPYLVDPNTGVAMYESDDIIRYLFETYGSGRPLAFRLGPITDVTSGLASLARPMAGSRARPSKAPDQPLELYSFEASPYCRLVRERLCELELRYLLHNVGKRSPSRQAFVSRSKKMMVPYLVDPNTGMEMFESAEILRYLDRTYASA